MPMTPLDRGQLWVMRIHAAALAFLLLVAGGVAEAVLDGRVVIPRGAILLPLLIVSVWIVFFAPARRFSRWGYRMDADELQVQHGLLTQVHTVVPLDRVQHLDIAQGPLERSFGVSRLIVHTAGTLHSQVLLPGLPREKAEAMRDEIRARIRQDAE
jgi:membrane protein YdbS with pleckstrin-like domain